MSQINVFRLSLAVLIYCMFQYVPVCSSVLQGFFVFSIAGEASNVNIFFSVPGKVHSHKAHHTQSRGVHFRTSGIIA